MRLLSRRDQKPAADRPRDLAADARAMRATLAELHAGQQAVHGAGSPVRLRDVVKDLLEGEIAAPTADVAALVRKNTEPGEFYERELAPAWDGLGESQRAGRAQGFIELARAVDSAGAVPGLEPEVVRTKALILAWAVDEAYGLISRLGRGEA